MKQPEDVFRLRCGHLSGAERRGTFLPEHEFVVRVTEDHLVLGYAKDVVEFREPAHQGDSEASGFVGHKASDKDKATPAE